MINLDETQRKKVAEWIAQGLKLSEIQNRLASELGMTLTYMDVRLLVDDLKLTPKDIERPKPSQSALAATGAPPAGGRPAAAAAGAVAQQPAPAGAQTGISLSVDPVMRPGTVVSGKVTFSDGNQADWYVNQAGRLGLVPQQTGYRPPAAELQQFQLSLEGELAKLGY